MLLSSYPDIRKRSAQICDPLQTEDYVVQPVADVSPPKWHLGHTTWFFETFVLKPYLKGYKEFNTGYNFVFNSYYETIGAHVMRTDRGNLSRPTVEDVYHYREYVDKAMFDFLMNTELTDEQKKISVLGLQHEQQHQELLFTDIKYILGHNPLFQPYQPSNGNEWKPSNQFAAKQTDFDDFIDIPEGIYNIGYEGPDFCFDNELSRHKVYLHNYSISSVLVTNGEYLEFIESGAYRDFKHWHAEGWDWVKNNQTQAPLYWHLIEGKWFNYALNGLKPLDMTEAVCHINFYEAAAFAAWKGLRLPTEFEWEIAATLFDWGQRWEWTESAYLPYPGFKKAKGAIGEYNGKFMINQMVLRGASEVTSPNHSRNTYRNFFHPHLRWQFTGIRLAK